jgi:hypothetical protein
MEEERGRENSEEHGHGEVKLSGHSDGDDGALALGALPGDGEWRS